MEVLKVIKTILYVTIPLCIFLIGIFNKKQDRSEVEEYLLNVIQKKGTYENKYLRQKIDKLNLFLSQHGADFNLGISKIWQYIALRLFIALGIFLVSNEILNIWFSIALGIIGLYVPDVIVKELNKSDNEKMFQDLKAVYDTLRIQTSAGIYVTNALMDCYLVVKNKRLKKALKQLSIDIIGDRDIDRAVNSLSVKFHNDYIDEFVTIITQFIQTGQLVKVLEELNKQMINIEDLMNQKRESKVERKMLTIVLLFFVGILAIAIYGLAANASFSINSM